MEYGVWGTIMYDSMGRNTGHASVRQAVLNNMHEAREKRTTLYLYYSILQSRMASPSTPLSIALLPKNKAVF